MEKTYNYEIQVTKQVIKLQKVTLWSSNLYYWAQSQDGQRSHISQNILKSIFCSNKIHRNKVGAIWLGSDWTNLDMWILWNTVVGVKTTMRNLEKHRKTTNWSRIIETINKIMQTQITLKKIRTGKFSPQESCFALTVFYFTKGGRGRVGKNCWEITVV